MKLVVLALAFLTSLICGCETPPSRRATIAPSVLASFVTPTTSLPLIVEVRASGAEVAALGEKNAVAEAMGGVEVTAKATPGVTDVKRIEGTRLMALIADQAAMQALANHPNVESIFENVRFGHALDRAVPLTTLTALPARMPHGEGATVVIVDDGVDDAHAFFEGRVTSGACFASPNQCPNGTDTQAGPGAGRNCPTCRHGTHVAGIAAGHQTVGQPSRGAAPGAYIYPIQVFGQAGTSSFADVMRAMVHVRDVVSLTAYVTSVNLSLGEFGPGDLCGVPGAMRSWQAIISELSRMGVAVVIASGNDGFKNRIRFPSCVPGAIAIGNSLIGFTGSDAGVNVTSNASPLLALLAPGTGIWSAIPGNNWAPMDGTSMASPLVAGGITSLRSAVDWPLADIRGSLVATGQNVIDAGNGVAYPRVNFAAAWNQLVAAAPATPFIYMKDTVGDTGNQPDPASVGRPLYESPDVWVRNTNDGFRNLHVHQNPEHGQPNYIYARVRNKGNASASGFVVAYYVPGGNAAVNSADWKEIGRSQVLSASPMGSTFHEIFWGSPPKPGHYCLLLKWFPAGTTPTLSFNDMPSAVANDRTLVWRNINIVDASSGPVSFEGGFVLDTSKATHIAIEFDSSMPEGEQWYMDVELPREAVINFSEPTMRYARLLSDGNPIRLRIPVRRGTLYLADLRTRGAPGVLPFKFTVHRLEGGRPRSPIPIGLRVQEVSNVQLHKSGADLDKGRPVNRGGSTYRLKL